MTTLGDLKNIVVENLKYIVARNEKMKKKITKEKKNTQYLIS